MRDVSFTIIESKYDNIILPSKEATIPWLELVELLSEHEVTEDKESMRLIIPATFLTRKEAHTLTDTGQVCRCGPNLFEWHMLVIDIDGQMTLKEAIKKFRKYEHMWHTSHSHKTEKKNGVDCFRIFFPLKTSVSHQEFRRRIQSLKEFCGLGLCDNTTLSDSRGFYLPSCPSAKEDEALYHHNVGEWLDALTFEVEPEKEPPKPRVVDYDDNSDDFKNFVLNKLYELNEVEYDTWWKICSAMQDGGYSYGDFESLTATIRTHRTNNCRGQWASSKRKKINYGYLVNLLKDEFGKNFHEEFIKPVKNTQPFDEDWWMKKQKGIKDGK